MTRLRRIVQHVVVPLVALGQVYCVLELMGARLWPPVAILVFESVIVVASFALAFRRKPEPYEMRWWALVGPAMWAVWGTLYFGAATITEPPHARTFDDSILARLPLVPAFTSVYLGVHVFSMLPYCVLPELRLLRRYLLGNALIILLSGVAWITLPVRLDRPPIPTEAPGFGAWLLRAVYEFDPTTNCFPSAHCAIAIYSAIAMRFASRATFVWGALTAIAICVSTVMTRQHYVADIAAGAVLASLAAYAVRRK